MKNISILILSSLVSFSCTKKHSLTISQFEKIYKKEIQILEKLTLEPYSTEYMEDETLKRKLSNSPINVILVESLKGGESGYVITKSFSKSGKNLSYNHKKPRPNQAVINTWNWPDGTETLEYYKLNQVNGSLKGFKIQIEVKDK